MAEPITSTGILLRAYPYSDTSRILRFLTPQHGLVSVIGKGVRSTSARGGAALETFAEGELTFTFRPQRDLHTLREFRQLESALSLGREVERFLGASLLAELLLSHALEGGDAGLYEWVRTALRALGRVEGEEVFGWIFAGSWRILGHLGFPPELESCVICGREIGELVAGEALGRFEVGAGGVACPSCAGQVSGPRIGPAALDQLRGYLEGEPISPEPGIRGHLALLEGFATHHLGGGSGFRTFSMLRALPAAGGGDFP